MHCSLARACIHIVWQMDLSVRSEQLRNSIQHAEVNKLLTALPTDHSTSRHVIDL